MSDYELSSGNFPYWTKNYWFLWWPTFVVVIEIPPERFIYLVKKEIRYVSTSKRCVNIVSIFKLGIMDIMIETRKIVVLHETRILEINKNPKEIILIKEEVVNVN